MIRTAPDSLAGLPKPGLRCGGLCGTLSPVALDGPAPLDVLIVGPVASVQCRAQPGWATRPNKWVGPLRRGPSHAEILPIETDTRLAPLNGQFGRSAAMTSSPSLNFLPSPHCFGAYVLSHLFGIGATRADVYSSEPVSVGTLRALLSLDDGIAIDIVSERKLVMNADYWVLTPGSAVHTLDPAVPVSEDLLLTAPSLAAGDSLQVLAVIAGFPWQHVDGALFAAVEHATDLLRDQPDMAELVARHLGFASASELIQKGERPHD